MDKFKNRINIMKEILDKIINMLDIYYHINNNFINNYSINKRNYFNLLNLNTLKDYNETLKKELDKAIKEDKVYVFSYQNFYNDNGEKYIGEMKNGKKDGKGIIYFNKSDKSGNKCYEGDFKNDKMEGKGVLIWNSGDRYEGAFKKSRIDGKGKIFWNNGDIYEGDFKKNKIEGKGIKYYHNGDRYEGDLKNYEMEGKGIKDYQNGDRYEGDWKNNKREGKGIYYKNNGEVYAGEYSVLRALGSVPRQHTQHENSMWRDQDTLANTQLAHQAHRPKPSVVRANEHHQERSCPCRTRLFCPQQYVFRNQRGPGEEVCHPSRAHERQGGNRSEGRKL